MSPRLIPALLLLAGCSADVPASTCGGGDTGGSDIVGGVYTAKVDGANLVVSGVVRSECALSAVYVGSWSIAPTVGPTGQAFSVTIPTASLARDAANGAAALSNACSAEEGDTAGAVAHDGTVTLPVAVYTVGSADPTCLADFTYRLGKPEDWLTLTPSPGQLPDDASSSSTVTLTTHASVIGEAVTWGVTDGTLTPAASVVLRDPTCTSSASCPGVATATVVATTGKPRVYVTATVGGVTTAAELPVVDAPTFLPATATVARGDDLVIDMLSTGELVEDSVEVNCGIANPSYDWSARTVTTQPVAAAPHDPAACTITVWDTFGQRGSLTLNVAPGVATSIDISTDVAWIPNDGGTHALVTVTSNLETVGASPTLTGGAFAPSAPVLEWDSVGGSDAVTTTLYTSTAPGWKTLGATLDGHTDTVRLLVAAAPTASVPTLTGEGAIDFRTDGTFVECGYSGGGSWTVRTEDGALHTTTDPVYTSLTDTAVGQVLTLWVPAPASTAEAWCTDAYGRAETVTVEPATTETTTDTATAE